MPTPRNAMARFCFAKLAIPRPAVRKLVGPTREGTGGRLLLFELIDQLYRSLAHIRRRRTQVRPDNYRESPLLKLRKRSSRSLSSFTYSWCEI